MQGLLSLKYLLVAVIKVNTADFNIMLSALPHHVERALLLDQADATDRVSAIQGHDAWTEHLDSAGRAEYCRPNLQQHPFSLTCIDIS